MNQSNLIEALGAHATSEAIDGFIKEHALPLVEPGFATFVYRGEADGVYFMPMIFGLPRRHPFRRLEGTDLWYLTLELPDHARVEYKFEIERDGHGEWIDDPLNPLRTHNPFGQNSVLRSWGYSTPDWTRKGPEGPEGTVEEALIPSRHLTGIRRVSLYLPPGFSGNATHHLIVFDGGDYLRYGGIVPVLDNLINQGLIPPLVVALSHPEERLAEYSAHRGHAGFVAEELVPWMENRFRRIGRPVLMGASMGAVAALHAAVVFPMRFDGLVLQSGTFARFPGGGAARRVLEPVVNFLKDFDASAVPHRVFVSCGRFERLVVENRGMAERFRRAGREVGYVEAPDGHTWEGWRDRLREALTFVYPVRTISPVSPAGPVSPVSPAS